MKPKLYIWLVLVCSFSYSDSSPSSGPVKKFCFQFNFKGPQCQGFFSGANDAIFLNNEATPKCVLIDFKQGNEDFPDIVVTCSSQYDITLTKGDGVAVDFGRKRKMKNGAQQFTFLLSSARNERIQSCHSPPWINGSQECTQISIENPSASDENVFGQNRIILKAPELNEKKNSFGFNVAGQALLLQGSEYSFKCFAGDNEQILDVSWFSMGPNGKKDLGRKPEIRMKSDEHLQSLSCTVGNDVEGKNKKISISSVVGESPTILTSKSTAELIDGVDNQAILCKTKGQPHPFVSWLKSDEGNWTELISSSKRIVFHSDDTSGLLFRNVDKRLGGIYSCSSFNSFGIESLKMNVRVVRNRNRRQFKRFSGNQVEAGTERRIMRAVPRFHWASSFSNNAHRRFPHRNRWTNSSLCEILNLILERLRLGFKVAVAKWDSGSPIEDLEREAVVIENVVNESERVGLDPKWAEKFFRDQIEANKFVQRQYFQQWKRNGGRPNVPPVDLGTEVRPEIDRINKSLIQQALASLKTRAALSCFSNVQHSKHKLIKRERLGWIFIQAMDKAIPNICTGYHIG